LPKNTLNEVAMCFQFDIEVLSCALIIKIFNSDIAQVYDRVQGKINV